MSEEPCWQRLALVIREITGLTASEEKINSFHLYLDQIIAWSRAQRITGFRTPEAIVDRLFIDSLLFLPLLPARPSRLVDIGSGVGAPGIPLRLADPGLSITLVESRRKRVSFLRSTLRALGLQDMQVLHGRAEELTGSNRGLGGSYDSAVMRSVGRPDKVVPLSGAYLRPGGFCVLSSPPGDGSLRPVPVIPGFTAHRAHVKIASVELLRAFLIFVKNT